MNVLGRHSDFLTPTGMCNYSRRLGWTSREQYPVKDTNARLGISESHTLVSGISLYRKNRGQSQTPPPPPPGGWSNIMTAKAIIPGRFSFSRGRMDLGGQHQFTEQRSPAASWTQLLQLGALCSVRQRHYFCPEVFWRGHPWNCGKRRWVQSFSMKSTAMIRSNIN